MELEGFYLFNYKLLKLAVKRRGRETLSDKGKTMRKERVREKTGENNLARYASNAPTYIIVNFLDDLSR